MTDARSHRWPTLRAELFVQKSPLHRLSVNGPGPTLSFPSVTCEIEMRISRDSAVQIVLLRHVTQNEVALPPFTVLIRPETCVEFHSEHPIGR